MWRFFSTKWKRPNCQSLVSPAVWWGAYWSSCRWWSHWSPLQMNRFSRTLCPLIGWRSVCPNWQNQLCPDWPNQLCETSAHRRSCWVCTRGPCQQARVRDAQCYKPLPPPRWPHKPLQPRRWCHDWWSLKASPWPLCQDLQRLHDPCGGTTCHWSSLGSQLKRPIHPAHMGLWDQC